jgi:hypothetical protein
MYDAELVRVGPDILAAIRDTAQHLPGRMNNDYKRQTQRLRKDLLERLRAIPKQPTHPFIWSFNAARQARARRWWFKAVRDGRVQTDGERYVRSGALSEGWEVEYATSDDGGIFSVRNSVPGAEYVYGPRQVPSHAESGWPNADVEILEFEVEAEDRLIETWYTACDPFAGVTSIPFL